MTLRVYAKSSKKSESITLEFEHYDTVNVIKCVLDDLIEEDNVNDAIFLGLTSVRDYDGMSCDAVQLYIAGWGAFCTWLKELDFARAILLFPDYQLNEESSLALLDFIRDAARKDTWKDLVIDDSLEIEFAYD